MSKPSSPRSATLSLNRQQVLEEDEYTAALSGIIARDFFPSLVHLDATNTYLDALQSEDTQLINESVRRLKDLSTPQSSTTRARHPAQTPGRTPYGNFPDDTPMRTPRTQNGSNKRPRYDTSISLDSFQAKYTSEDNASFTEIIQEENRKRKERSGWAWEAQQRAQNVKAIETDRRNRLFIEDTTTRPPGVRERLMVEQPQVKMITSGTDTPETSENGRDGVSNDISKEGGERQIAPVKKTPTSVIAAGDVVGSPTEVDVLAPTKDTRSAAVDGWSFKTRNSLMFTPDADISPYDGPTSLPAAEPKGPAKQIHHSNTRLLEDPNESGEGSSSVPPSPTRSKIDAAIAGTPYVPRGERPNFSLLPSLPSPTPSQLGPAAVNKLMTWGTITSTPRVLSSDDDTEPAAPAPSTPFHLPGPTPREKLAHKLSSTASRSLRAKASLLSGTPVSFPRGRRQSSEMTPGTPRPHPGLLTPAARRLLDRTAGPGSATARRTDGTQNRSSWEGGTKPKEMGSVRWTPSTSHSSR